jgi:hypothetical protein
MPRTPPDLPGGFFSIGAEAGDSESLGGTAKGTIKPGLSTQAKKI